MLPKDRGGAEGLDSRPRSPCGGLGDQLRDPVAVLLATRRLASWPAVALRSSEGLTILEGTQQPTQLIRVGRFVCAPKCEVANVSR